MRQTTRTIPIATPGLIRAAALTGYFEVAEELGLNVIPLMRETGITRAMLRNPELPVPARAAISLVEKSVEVSGCLTFGLRMVERRRLGDVGILSVLIAHQESVRDALAVIDRYRARLNPSLCYQQRTADDQTWLSPHFQLPSPAPLRQASDIALAVLHNAFASIFENAWRPVQLCLSCSPLGQADREVYERVFSCPVEFDHSSDALIIRTADLDIPNPRSDPKMARHARDLVEAMIDPEERAPFEEVEAAVLMNMEGQRLSLQTVADGLGMSARALQRRLEAEGTTFSAVVGRARRMKVERYILDLAMPLTEIASRLGFSSETSFSRWYREQAGESPSRTRRRGFSA